MKRHLYSILCGIPLRATFSRMADGLSGCAALPALKVAMLQVGSRGALGPVLRQSSLELHRVSFMFDPGAAMYREKQHCRHECGYAVGWYGSTAGEGLWRSTSHWGFASSDGMSLNCIVCGLMMTGWLVDPVAAVCTWHRSTAPCFHKRVRFMLWLVSARRTSVGECIYLQGDYVWGCSPRKRREQRAKAHAQAH